jgi:hypothetical protein
MDSFGVELLSQNWIDNVPDDGGDLCSHGKILLTVNDMILCDENSVDWTVAASGLRLMKSAIYGYDSKSEFELIPCCGYLKMFPSCTRYITWDTAIKDNIILLSNVQCSKTNNDELKVLSDRFEIRSIDYVEQVLSFGNKIKEFYASALERTFDNKWEKENYELFWREFNEYQQILAEKIG